MNNYFVWVEITANTERILNADLFSEAMGKCAERGIDSVVLSVKDTSGFAIYNSQYAPHYSKLKSNFQEIDYLQQCLEIAHKHGLKLYASIDVFAEGNKHNQNPLMKGLTNEGWMSRDLTGHPKRRSYDRKKEKAFDHRYRTGHLCNACGGDPRAAEQPLFRRKQFFPSFGKLSFRAKQRGNRQL